MEPTNPQLGAAAAPSPATSTKAVPTGVKVIAVLYYIARQPRAFWYFKAQWPVCFCGHRGSTWWIISISLGHLPLLYWQGTMGRQKLGSNDSRGF